MFPKRATKYRSLVWKITYKDKGSYESSPPCTTTGRRIHRSIVLRLPLSSPTWYVYRDSFKCVTCLIMCVTWLIQMCEMTHSNVWHASSCVWHDSFICMPWLIHMYTMTPLHDVFLSTSSVFRCLPLHVYNPYIQRQTSPMYTIENISHVYNRKKSKKNCRYLTCIQWRISHMCTIEDMLYVYYRIYVVNIQWEMSSMYIIVYTWDVLHCIRMRCLLWCTGYQKICHK